MISESSLKFNNLAYSNIINNNLAKQVMRKYQFTEDDSRYYMDIGMVSEYLHLAKSTIYKWVESGYIPHKRLGRHLRFIKKDIDQWVENDGIIKNDLPELPKSIKNNYDGEIQIRA